MHTIYDPRYTRMIAYLRERRLALRLTQAEVAQRLHRPRTWVGKVEQCERRLDILELIALARIYGTALADLEAMLGREGKRP